MGNLDEEEKMITNTCMHNDTICVHDGSTWSAKQCLCPACLVSGNHNLFEVGTLMLTTPKPIAI